MTTAAASATFNLALIPDETLRICRLSGSDVQLKKSLLLQLHDCEKLLEQCERDALTALSSHQKWQAAELAAGVLLLAIDTTMMVLESKAGIPGMAVGKFYSGFKLLNDVIQKNVDAKTAFMLLAENKATIIEMSAKELGYNKAHKAIENTKMLVLLTHSFWELITNTSVVSRDDEGIKGALQTVRSQLTTMRTKIAELKIALNNC